MTWEAGPSKTGWRWNTEMEMYYEEGDGSFVYKGSQE